MSGTAALSAAKNRRSGNEVKFNGQSKSLPPPQDPRQQQQQNGRQQTNGRQQQQPPQQQQQPQRMQVPHPMEILKSHEMRLRELEGSAEQPSETNTVTNTDDYAALQSETVLLKSDNAALKNSVSILEKKITVLLERTIYLEQIITGTKGRVEDFNTTVTNLSTQLSNVESSVSEHSRFIAALGSESEGSRDTIQLNESDDRVSEPTNITLEIAPLN